MPVPVMSVVRRVLEPYHPIIHDALIGGWTDCRNLHEAGRWRRKGTRAAYVWEHTVDRAIAALVDDRNVYIHEHHDTVSFIVEDTVLFRFKKGDDSRLSSNVRTGLARLFHDHETDLFGYTGLQRVQVVYVLDRWQSEIREIAVVARDDNNVIWHYPVEPSGQPEILPFNRSPAPTLPTDPVPQPDTNTADLAQPKPGSALGRKKSEDDE